MTRRLVWRLFFFFTLVAATVLVVSTVVSWQIFDRFFREQTLAELRSDLIALERMLHADDILNRQEGLQEIVRDFGARLGVRFTVVAPDGRVLADSDENPAQMANHADRPEIRDAFAGLVGVSSRYSPTLKREQLYLALRVREGSETRFVVRASKNLYALNEAVWPLLLELALLTGLLLVIVAIVSWLFARRIGTSLRALQERAERFAAGDLRGHLAEPPVEEFARLARSLNMMATELERRLAELATQKGELEAIFASLDEALILADRDERVLWINAAAGRLFHVSPDTATGKSLIGVLGNRALAAFARAALASETSIEQEIDLLDSEGHILFAHSTPVPGDTQRVLFVFSDLTHLKKLENIRKEFVANVSHELRTPITSIKGYVETLRDGALNDPEAARRFLDIIARQSERLGAIIEDLLALSKIERDAEQGEIVTAPAAILPILTTVAQTFAERAAKRAIRMEISCPDDLVVSVNAPLIEQAVANLVDNAVKYSHDGGTITLAASVERNEVVLSVTDTGIGIPSEHLPRLFERFYRVDKARSRAAGGTGLGLAIVKHIALAHRGSVSVKSEIGKGSTFTITIPLS